MQIGLTVASKVTFCHIKPLELDWLAVADVGGEDRVDVGGGACVLVVEEGSLLGSQGLIIF